MKMFMLNMAMRFVGDNPYKGLEENKAIPEWIRQILVPILGVLNTLLLPLIIILGVAGTIYAIVLGVQFAKAESADKRDETKKRLINAVIGLVIILVALIGMKIFIVNAPSLFNWVSNGGSDTAQ